MMSLHIILQESEQDEISFSTAARKLKDEFGEAEYLQMLKDGYFDKLELPVGGSPVFEDMDFDGDLDMVIGTEKGTLVYFRNTGR